MLMDALGAEVMPGGCLLHTHKHTNTEIHPIHAREYTDNCRSSQAETLLEAELGNLLRLPLASDPEKVELHWQNVGWNLWR